MTARTLENIEADVKNCRDFLGNLEDQQFELKEMKDEIAEGVYEYELLIKEMTQSLDNTTHSSNLLDELAYSGKDFQMKSEQAIYEGEQDVSREMMNTTQKIDDLGLELKQIKSAKE